MTEQGDEEVLTVQRHVIWPVGLTSAQEVEHLCRDSFNPGQVQLLNALVESDDFQDADTLRRTRQTTTRPIEADADRQRSVGRLDDKDIPFCFELFARGRILFGQEKRMRPEVPILVR
jgi:hypothetical protein